jgi:hypothetical protein
MKLTEVNIDNLDRLHCLLEHGIQVFQRTCIRVFEGHRKRRVHEGSSREGTVSLMFDSVNLPQDLGGGYAFPIVSKIVELGVVESWKHMDEEEGLIHRRTLDAQRSKVSEK